MEFVRHTWPVVVVRADMDYDSAVDCVGYYSGTFHRPRPVGRRGQGLELEGLGLGSMKQVIKTFDSVAMLGQRFESEVFQDISGESLFVYRRADNAWYRYRWTSGKREIRFVEETSGELPLVVQVYP